MWRVFFFSFLLFIGAGCFGQITFQKTYGGPSEDRCYDVKQCMDGGYILTGYKTNFGALKDIWIVKTNASGDTLWTKSFGGTNEDCGYSVDLCADGGYIITGYTESFGAGSREIILIKIDSIGGTAWEKTYGGTDWEWGFDVNQTSDGGYIVCGITKSYGAGMTDAYLIKTDNLGALLWTKTFGGADWDWGLDVKQCTDGGYIVAGITESFGAGNEDVYLIRTDDNGNTLWTSTYGGIERDGGSCIQQCQDGGFIISGYTHSYGVGDADVYVIKTNTNGIPLWSKTYGHGGTTGDTGESIKQCTDGGFIIGGWTETPQGGAANGYIIRITFDGDTLFTRKFGGTEHEFAFSIEQCSDGGYIIGGTTQSFGDTWGQFYLVKSDVVGSSGCNEFTTNTSVTIPATIVGFPTSIVDSGGSESAVSSTLQIIDALDSTLCYYVGIDQFIENTVQFKVYPNPTTGKFTVQGATDEIEVYDLYGRLVLRTNEPEIDMSSYPKGVYVLRAGEATRKLIIQ